MKGNQQVIDHLNTTLRNEFTAIHQYFVHAEMCENWGYKRIAAEIKKQSIGEMIHAEKLIERILFLEGAPNMADLLPLRIGQTVKAQLENDIALELEAIPQLNGAIKTCVEVGDNGSRELFEKILLEEEEHVDWLEAQLGMIEDMGLGLYLSEQMGGDGDDG